MNHTWYKRIWSNFKARLGIIIVFIFTIIAIIGPFIFNDPNAYVDTPLQKPSLNHLFGTTKINFLPL